MCRTFGAHFLSLPLSRTDGRAYSLPDLRPSFDRHVRAPWPSLEEAADNSRGREAVVEGNSSIERRRCGTKSNFGEIGFLGINALKIKDKDMLYVHPISELRLRAAQSGCKSIVGIGIAIGIAIGFDIAASFPTHRNSRSRLR
jgi:hypothetical protein